MIPQEAQHSLPLHENSRPETHRVLIVDDEQAICFAYRKLLESERFSFDICDNISDALVLLQKYDYFAVISDVRFAGSDNQDGIYFISVVRNNQPQAKVILVTGYGNDELKKTARELETFRYFEKPVKPSLLLSLLRDLHLVEDEREEHEFFKNMQLIEG